MLDRQFGFLKVRSTIDVIEMVMTIAKEAISGKRWLEGDKEYCVIITSNAFKTGDCDAKLAALNGKDVPNYLLELIKDYFQDSGFIYNTEDDRKWYAVSVEVPQGSVQGPIL